MARIIIISAFAAFFILTVSFIAVEKNFQVNNTGAWSDQDEKELNKLKKNFTLEKNNFDPIGYWIPNWQARLKATGIRLRVYVAEDGSMHMDSFFIGSKHINHNQVIVKIGTEYFHTDTIDLKSVCAKSKGYLLDVTETLTFKDCSDKGVLDAIGKSDIQRTVYVRLVGSRDNFDYSLSYEDHKAFTDAYKLSEMLKRKLK